MGSHPQKAIKVGIIIGSLSDEETMFECAQILKRLEIPFAYTVSSAHRSPERTLHMVKHFENRGAQIFICAAGMANHLAGTVAAHTCKPVIGVPLSASPLGGMDALLSTVQMPPGVPVATVALDKAGAKNAAWLAAQILALQDSGISLSLERERSDMHYSVVTAGDKVEAKW